MPAKTRVRSAAAPSIRIRPGARFRCFGDGVCCTDLHAFGPLSPSEVQLLCAIDPGVVAEHHGQAVVVPVPPGRCPFLDGQHCALHARLGPDAKPRSCTQFPLRWVATPTVDRVVTEHRCPCRTMGDRPALTVAAALPSLGPEPDLTIEGPIEVEGRAMPFASYEQSVEAPLLSAILDGAGAAAFVIPWEAAIAPARARLAALSAVWADTPPATGQGAALMHFGRALAGSLACGHERAEVSTPPGEPPQPPPAMSWDAGFERAEKRSILGRPEAVFDDWLADTLFGLDWLPLPFDTFRRELSVRYAVACRLADALAASGRRADRAAAESVAMAELVGLSDAWQALWFDARPAESSG